MSVTPAGIPLVEQGQQLAQGVLGACLTRLGRYDEAEPLMLGSYEQLQSQRGDADPYTRDALNNLIRFYERWGKPDRAAHFRART